VTVIVDALEPVEAVMFAGEADTVLASALTPPAVPVALNTTGLPSRSRLPTAADSVFSPAAGPSRHSPTVATPFASVTGTLPSTAPPPAVTVNVTGMPPSGLPSSSRTTTAGSTGTASPAVASWSSPVRPSIEAGAPTPSAMGGVTAGAKETAANISRWVPGEPRMARSVKVTTPSASLVADVVPSSVPPPVEIATVTSTPSRAIGVPSSSSRRSCGWGDSGSPETAIAGTCEVMTRRAARPVLRNWAFLVIPSTEASVK
jgi:hypothetical protein